MKTNADRDGSPPISAWRMLRMLTVLLGSVLAGGWLRGWLAEPPLLSVHEASMAPNLFGDHAQLRCTVCGALQRLDPAGLAVAADQATCDACGRNYPVPAAWQVVAGDCVQLTPLPPMLSESDRWQMVAWQHATPDGQPAGSWVKRLVGLPGEQLAIVDGDLAAQGRLIQKDLAQLRSLAVPVVDWHGEPAAESPWTDTQKDQVRRRASCWEPADPSIRWGEGQGGSGFQVEPSRHDRNWHWLHFRGRDVVGRQGERTRVLDDLAYNQGESRRLFPVADLWLRTEVSGRMRGQLATELQLNHVVWRATWDAETCRIDLDRDGRRVASCQLTGPYATRRLVWEFAHCDRRLLIALNGTQVLTHADVDADAAGGERYQVTALAVGFRQPGPGPVTVCGLQLRRDIHYLTRTGDDFGPLTPDPLGPQRCLLLGDNPARSIDGRQLGPTQCSRLWGRVVRDAAQVDGR